MRATYNIRTLVDLTAQICAPVTKLNAQSPKSSSITRKVPSLFKILSVQSPRTFSPQKSQPRSPQQDARTDLNHKRPKVLHNSNLTEKGKSISRHGASPPYRFELAYAPKSLKKCFFENR
jgi:hypothetical protein